MPVITFISADGTEHKVEADSGDTVRNAAVQNDVPGIDGDCGGECACATCHIYVTADWIEKVGRLEEESMEHSLLQFADDFRETSRLGCQIPITDDLNGLVLEIPLGQH